MKWCLVFLLAGFSLTGYTQKVGWITADELENRMAQGSDTTYVVNFWATWCGPCVQELPHFDRLQKENLHQPLKVLLVSLDLPSKQKKKVIPFVRRRKISSEVFILNEPDQQAAMKRIAAGWTGAIPATLFYNKKKGLNRFIEQKFTYESLQATLLLPDL